MSRRFIMPRITMAMLPAAKTVLEVTPVTLERARDIVEAHEFTCTNAPRNVAETLVRILNADGEVTIQRHRTNLRSGDEVLVASPIGFIDVDEYPDQAVEHLAARYNWSFVKVMGAMSEGPSPMNARR